MPAHPNAYFFTGDNSFSLSEELRRWKAGFIAKHGPENLTVLQAADQTAVTLMDAVAVMPFIAQKRLVVCEGIPRLEKEELTGLLDAMHPQTIFAIVQSKPDKRLKIVKEIAQQTQVRQFDSWKQPELIRWVCERAKAAGASIESSAAKQLIAIVGEDPWMLAGEIDKMSTFAQGSITPALVETMAIPSGSQAIWQLSDLVGARKTDEALRFLTRRLERGEDPYGLWVILLTIVKNVAAIWAAWQSGIRSDRDLASSSGVPFFGIRGLMPLVQSLNGPAVKNLVHLAIESDIALKTGGYKYSADQPGELMAVTERLMLTCSQF